MISPTFATVIIISFILIFGIGVPVLNVKASKYISYRWCAVVVILALLIGAIVDFDGLSDSNRQIVLIGGIVTGGVYVVLRTIEKVLSNGWLQGSKLKAQKGDISIELSSDSDKENKQKNGEKNV